VPNLPVPRQVGRNSGDQVFREAARHSRFVRLLRFVIPAAILAITTVILVATFFNPFHLIVKFPIDIDKITFSSTKIEIKLPRVKGYTTDSRPYELTARAAQQDLLNSDFLELKDISAKVELRDGQLVTLESISGVYDQKGEVLRFNDPIILKASSGYESRLTDATVNVGSGNIVSERPVEVRLPNGFLTANRLEVKENGALIMFGGGVEMNITPEQVQAVTQSTASADAPAPARRAASSP
jgi:lipopolysaccharide export system protein LptC